MRRIKLIVAYDGTKYSGWQVQNNADTIEGRLNAALSSICGENIRVIGASRTDAGVHALGNIAVFDTESRIPAEKFAYALNARLPEDIVVQKSCEVPPDYHPRHCSTIKTYEYHILNRTFRLPQMRNNTFFCHYALDLETMNEAAQYLLGEHDFKSFCGNNKMKKSTVRTIYDITIAEEEGYLRMTFHGNGFLQNMVRILTGTLLEVGYGRKKAEDMEAILAACDRQMAGPTAPPHGLMLLEVEYGV